MELIPIEIRKQIPSLYSTENQKDPTVFCKLFLDNWTWYVTEISIDNNICFGYVVSPYEKELGYFSLDEIKEVRNPFGLKIERDFSFKPVKLSKIKDIED